MIIYLEGINFRQYNGVEYRLKPDLQDYPGGERDLMMFRGKIRNFPQGLDQATVPIMVTNCYLYATYAAPQVCIDPAPLDAGRKVCTPRDITYNGGNGAPVAITIDCVVNVLTPFAVLTCTSQGEMIFASPSIISTPNLV